MLAMHPIFFQFEPAEFRNFEEGDGFGAGVVAWISTLLYFYLSVPFLCLLPMFSPGNSSTDRTLFVLFWLEGCCLPWWRRYEILPTKTAILLLRFFSLLLTLRYGRLQCERGTSLKGSSSVLPQCPYLFVCHAL